jgi:hypothetical protein
MSQQPHRGASIASVLLITITWTGCSRPSLMQVATGPCPTYSGGSATPTSLAGNYTAVSYCQNTLPSFDPAGTLTITASPDSFRAWLNRGRLSPVTLAGRLTVSGDAIAVSSPRGSWGPLVGTYAFSANTLYVSGTLTNSGLVVAIVATK